MANGRAHRTAAVAATALLAVGLAAGAANGAAPADPTAPRLTKEGAKVTYLNPEFAFKIIAPDKHWSLSCDAPDPLCGDGTGHPFIRVVVRSDEIHSDNHPSVTVTAEYVQPEVRTVADYVDLNVRALEKMGFSILSVTPRKWHALPAVEVRANGEGGYLKVVQIYLLRRSQGFVLMASCLDPIYERIWPELDKVMHTFEIDGPDFAAAADGAAAPPAK
ncbi:MAG TPA: hypothetical protein VG389_15685 [Myxococcota bacterium]|jgi:hypothetical protein|nr:hypothetical protein [Myxococcota bacterium]